MAWVRFRKKEMPGGLWNKCPRCGEMLYAKDLEANLNVCPKCSFHLPCNVDERIRFTLDEGSYVEVYEDLKGVDRLEFKDKTTYAQKLEDTAAKVKHNEAMSIGLGTINGRLVSFGAMNFRFLGGSMGVVVGEKVTLAVELAMERNLPLILVSASGGARMHEGALSLMQMAKTCNALARFSRMGGLYISVLSDPTTGGVTASFATMGDVILAEPEALIGFAGPRVIQNTIKQDLPEGFQRSEFLEKRGQIDVIVSRLEMRATLTRLIDYMQPAPAPAAAGAPAASAASPAPAPTDSLDPARPALGPSDLDDTGLHAEVLELPSRHLDNGTHLDTDPDPEPARAALDPDPTESDPTEGRPTEKPKKKKK